MVLSFGVDMLARSVTLDRHGSLTLPAREGDITVFGQPPGNAINDDHWSTLTINTGPYVNAEITAGRLTLTPGLRFDPVLIEGSPILPVAPLTAPRGYARFDLPNNPIERIPSNPVSRALRDVVGNDAVDAGAAVLGWVPNLRLIATFRAAKRLTLTAGGGFYGQPPDPEDMSPVFGNPSVGVSRAAHLSGGGAFKLRPTLTLEMVGFYKRLYDLVSRNELSTPPIAQSLTQDGIGRAYGGQALLRQELLRGFFGWISYSYIRSERKDHADTDWRLFDFDQTHVLAVLASYQIGHGWEAGARFRYTTGFPRTPVINGYDNLANLQSSDPIFGDHNSIRIPAFYQLDARVERVFVLRRTKVNIFLDVQNVTNRKNPEEIIYNDDFKVRAYITGFPTLAVLGTRMEF
jgi:hypothetical protein